MFGLTNEAAGAAAFTSGFVSFPRATKKTILLRTLPQKGFKDLRKPKKELNHRISFNFPVVFLIVELSDTGNMAQFNL